MASSAVVSVKKALRDALQENPNLDGVQVEYGWPGDDLAERERIFLGRARLDTTPGPMRTGRVHRNETGELDIVVHAAVVGGSPEDADDRVIAIGLEVENVVADNRNVGNDNANGISVTAVTMRRGELLNAYNDHGSVSQLTYTLQWTARLA